MAISTLKGSNKWVELATATSTSGSTVSFTSIPEYPEYLIQGFNVDASTQGPDMRLNNDTGSNYSWIRDTTELGLVTTSIQVAVGGTDASFQVHIIGANGPVKQIDIWSGSTVGATKAANRIRGLWNDSSIINRIDFICTGTYSSGSFKVYGRN